MRSFVVLAAVLLASCEPQIHYPQMTVLPDGARGFSFEGYTQFTRDEARARADIQARAAQLCPHGHDVVDHQIRRADAIAAPHLYYNAVVRCRPAPS